MSWETLDPATQALAEHKLTPRQLAVLKARLNGLSWRTIGYAYIIDEATARGHYRRALQRLEQARKDTPA